MVQRYSASPTAASGPLPQMWLQPDRQRIRQVLRVRDTFRLTRQSAFMRTRCRKARWHRIGLISWALIGLVWIGTATSRIGYVTGDMMSYAGWSFIVGTGEAAVIRWYKTSASL